METVFSQLLTKYIHSKDINVYSMAQFCGADRANMYKYISGDRKPPSLELVRKMSAFMQLTPNEYDSLLEAYNIASVGAKTYYRRKAILNLLTNFENYTISEASLTTVPPSRSIPLAEVTVLNGQTKLLQYIFDILMLESSKKNGYVRLLMPPDFPAVIEYLVSLGYHEHTLKIEHIFCLNNAEQSFHHEQPYNLECLRKILPLYVCGCSYNSYYYYKDSPPDESLLSLFPYLVLTSENALIFSESLMKGILFHNTASVSLYQEVFQKCIQTVLPLATKIPDVMSQLCYLQKLDLKTKNTLMFEPVPCMTYFMPESFLEKYVYKDSDFRSSTLELLTLFFSQAKENFKNSKTSFIFTEQGIRNFLETGRIEEYPSNIYAPFSTKDRLYLIRLFMKTCDPSQMYLLRDHSFPARNGIYIYITPNNGYLMIPVANESLEYSQIFLDLSEPGLLTDFYDFCSYLKDDCCYSYKDAIGRLENILLEYQ